MHADMNTTCLDDWLIVKITASIAPESSLDTCRSVLPITKFITFPKLFILLFYEKLVKCEVCEKEQACLAFERDDNDKSITMRAYLSLGALRSGPVVLLQPMATATECAYA